MEKLYLTKCFQCGLEFEKRSCHQPKYKFKLSTNRTTNEFCSKTCQGKFKSNNGTISCNCGWCDKSIIRHLKEFNKSKSGLIFCNSSCAASYNNTKKRKTNRSKCEKLLFDLLNTTYPDLNLIPNGKTLLSGFECDIEILSLNLGIEWNGIVHYKPIYGEEKLQKIQSIDEKKQNIAQENNIRLIVIPDLVSTEKYVKEAFYKICQIINEIKNGS